MHSCAYCSITYNSQTMEAAQVSIDWWMDKDVVYIYDGISLSHQKEWNLAICKDVDGARMYYAKQNKSEKTNTIWFQSYLEFMKQNKWTKENKKRQTKKQILNCREQTDGYHSWGDEWNR